MPINTFLFCRNLQEIERNSMGKLGKQFFSWLTSIRCANYIELLTAVNLEGIFLLHVCLFWNLDINFWKEKSGSFTGCEVSVGIYRLERGAYSVAGDEDVDAAARNGFCLEFHVFYHYIHSFFLTSVISTIYIFMYPQYLLTKGVWKSRGLSAYVNQSMKQFSKSWSIGFGPRSIINFQTVLC